MPKVLTDIKQCWLYAIASPTDLACRLSTPKMTFSVSALRELAKDDGNFHHFTNNKARAIQEPKRQLQMIHARVHKLLSRVPVPDYLHSAVRGRSYLSNAAAHNLAAATIKIDIKKFFPSVPRVAIFNFFQQTMRCRRDVAGLLADLLTCDGKLATGSSASPIMSFYAFKPMFDEIERFAAEKKLTLTCYIDDMCLSGELATKAALFHIKTIIARYGLKSHKARSFAPFQPKVITGVCNTPEGARVPNDLHLKIKQGFDALRSGATPMARELILRPLLGRLEAAGQIDPAFRGRARTLRACATASACETDL